MLRFYFYNKSSVSNQQFRSSMWCHRCDVMSVSNHIDFYNKSSVSNHIDFYNKSSVSIIDVMSSMEELCSDLMIGDILKVNNIFTNVQWSFFFYRLYNEFTWWDKVKFVNFFCWMILRWWIGINKPFSMLIQMMCTSVFIKKNINQYWQLTLIWLYVSHTQWIV